MASFNNQLHNAQNRTVKTKRSEKRRKKQEQRGGSKIKEIKNKDKETRKKLGQHEKRRQKKSHNVGRINFPCPRKKIKKDVPLKNFFLFFFGRKIYITRSVLLPNSYFAPNTPN